MYRQQQMSSERLLTMAAKCLSLPSLFLSLFLSLSLSVSLIPPSPLFIPHISFTLSPKHFYDSSGNLSTLHTANFINHLRSPTHMYHSCDFYWISAVGEALRPTEPRVFNLHLLRGVHFVKCLFGAKMRPKCKSTVKTERTFHLIQWQSFPIVYLAHGINKAVM